MHLYLFSIVPIQLRLPTSLLKRMILFTKYTYFYLVEYDMCQCNYYRFDILILQLEDKKQYRLKKIKWKVSNDTFTYYI